MPNHAPLKPGDHVYLVDGSGFIFRAYHALPPLSRKSDGVPVGAVQGFCNMLWKLLRDMQAVDRPTHLAVVFDHSSQSFRNALYPEYKANRTEPPADLRPQFGLIRQAVRAFNVACVEMAGFEADDLIATYATQAVAQGATCRIVSSDKDLMQLVRPGVGLYDTMKDREMGAEAVFEKFGVTPDKVIDVQALAGDSIDNVPGVPGIGVKTGALLINQYGDLDNLLAHAADIPQQKRRESLIAFADQARLSRELVTLKVDVPVEVPLADFGVSEPRASEVIGFLKAMEFASLTRKVGSELDISIGDIDASPVTVNFWPPEGGVPEAPARRTGTATGKSDAAPQAAPPAPGDGDNARPIAPILDREPALRAIPFHYEDYETVQDMATLERWIAAARAQGFVAFDTETTSLDAMRATLVGVSLALAVGKACYIPLDHRASDGLDLAQDSLVQIPKAQALAALRPLLEDPATLKIGQNIKYDMLVLAQHGLGLHPIEDTMLLSYCEESGLTTHGMDALSEFHLGHTPVSYKSVAGSGKSAITFDQVPLDVATRYAAEDADITLRLYDILKPRLASQHVTRIYETLERPLVPVLVEMERAGILVDRAVLARLSAEFAALQAKVEIDVFALAGEHFNVGSPKQLGDILFGKMGLPGGRKTPTGAWSTDSDTLDNLAAQGIDLARRVVDWRQLAKLRSTYTDALPAHIHPQTGRVHTSYSMAATSTGRLSSTDPNLQNIPIRTEEGRRIRTAFIAAPGSKLISADYSQIELRVLAHVADIPQLKRAFAEDLDIHAMTASEMFAVPVEGMDPMVRRRAKAINFGIIYGISAFGLAQQLSISREEAGEYIRTYFKRFPGIRDYMEAVKETVRRQHYVETIFGRRAHFPKIASPNPSERAFMERAAINAPIQGAAADIIRRAMVRMAPALVAAGLKARMLLQVHDELVFEATDDEVEATMALARSVMEGAAAPAVHMSVPLKVEAHAGQNWEAAH